MFQQHSFFRAVLAHPGQAPVCGSPALTLHCMGLTLCHCRSATSAGCSWGPILTPLLLKAAQKERDNQVPGRAQLSTAALCKAGSELIFGCIISVLSDSPVHNLVIARSWLHFGMSC